MGVAAEQPHLFFNSRPHVWVNEVGVDFLVAVNQDDAEGCRDELAARPDGDVVALADVVDVHRDGGIWKVESNTCIDVKETSRKLLRPSIKNVELSL